MCHHSPVAARETSAFLHTRRMEFVCSLLAKVRNFYEEQRHEKTLHVIGTNRIGPARFIGCRRCEQVSRKCQGQCHIIKHICTIGLNLDWDRSQPAEGEYLCPDQ